MDSRLRIRRGLRDRPSGAQADGPTALFAANDQMALGLLAGLDDAGVSVPAELSIVGLDDNPDAAYYRPALTTARLDTGGEAARCIAAVLGVTAPEAPRAPVLITRASSAAAPR